MEGLTRLHARPSSRAVLALADQAVVSGIGFLTTIVIGRVCGKPELGIYALGMSVVLLAIAAQQSLISAAHTVFSVRLEDDARRQYNGAIVIQFVALCLLIALVLGAVSLGLGVFQEATETSRVLNVLLLVCPTILLREFARRFEFARFNMLGAFLLDLGIAVLVLTILSILAYCSVLSGATALLAVGSACGLAGSAWWLTSRGEFRVVTASLADEFRRGWQFGRWVFGGQISFALVGFSLQWITAAMIGEAAVGVYSACLMLVLIANPIVLGLQNVLSPSIAKSMHEGGNQRVRRLVLRSTVALTLMMSVYVTIIAIWGDLILQQLYGSGFAGHGITIGLLGWGALATAAGVSSNHGLRAIERPELNCVAAVLGLVVGVVTAYCLIPSWGVTGAAIGFAVSCTLTSGARMISFVSVSRVSAEASQ